MPLLRAVGQKKKRKEQKQHHINETENIFLKVLLQKVLEITTRSHLAGLTAVLYGIPNILEDSSHIIYPQGIYKYSSDKSAAKNGLCGNRLPRAKSKLLRIPVFYHSVFDSIVSPTCSIPGNLDDQRDLNLNQYEVKVP
ncbi:hypothetical protein TNCV_4406041 [Trichonephila clavipes]|nr:hypothetical protein TNCV_4406041 [Trichonephila clavipes]